VATPDPRQRLSDLKFWPQSTDHRRLATETLTSPYSARRERKPPCGGRPTGNNLPLALRARNHAGYTVSEAKGHCKQANTSCRSRAPPSASASASRTGGVAAQSGSPRRTTSKKKKGGLRMVDEDERVHKSGLRDLAIGSHRDAVPRLEPQGGVFFRQLHGWRFSQPRWVSVGEEQCKLARASPPSGAKSTRTHAGFLPAATLLGAMLLRAQ